MSIKKVVRRDGYKKKVSEWHIIKTAKYPAMEARGNCKLIIIKI
jgi:hypothetical protein